MDFIQFLALASPVQLLESCFVSDIPLLPATFNCSVAFKILDGLSKLWYHRNAQFED